LATEADISKTVGDDLDENYVNAIRLIQNTIRIYGARSLSGDEDNFRYITTQDILNSVVVDAQRSLEDLVFSSIDGRNTIYSDISSRLTAICSRLKDLGALFEARNADGSLIDLGYTVRCDASLNPVSQLAGGTVRARVGLRTSGVGDKIEVEITKSNLTASVVQ
jgi:phage tail sheath protein FI